MLSAYPACFFKEENGYSVIFPDLNWLATCGDTLEEATSMAIDCLAGYLYSERQDGNDIPNPSDMSSISPDAVAEKLQAKNDEESFVNVISVDVDKYIREHYSLLSGSQ